MTDAPTWFEDELPVDAPRRRRRAPLLVALVAASWIVLALVLVRGQGAAPAVPAGDGGADGTATRDVDAPGPHVPDTTSPPSDVPGEPHEPPGEQLPEPPATTQSDAPIGRDAAEAVVLAVLRGWLSDGGPDLDVPGLEVDRRAYLEHVALEDFDVPTEELAVARVLVVLLVRDDDRYSDAIVRRAAVPLTLTATSVHPGGEPWWLPTRPDLTPVPPVTSPDGEDVSLDEVAAALTAAGYQDVAVADVAATEGGTLVAEVTARTPDGDPVDGSVWLHPSPAGLLVLGGPHTDAGADRVDDGPPD